MDKNETIDNLRAAMGTLPSMAPPKTTTFVKGCSKLKVEMVPDSGPTNPYRTFVESAGATWGNNEYLPKWSNLSPENRFKVALAVLTKNTLPQAVEPVTWTWRVTGLPRNCFDQHARARIGSTFFSIGSRDNNKLDADIILYSNLFEKMFGGDPKCTCYKLPDGLSEKATADWIQSEALGITPFGKRALLVFCGIKNMYEEVLADGAGNWQTARAFLPMSYHHSYHFSQNLLALQGQCARRMSFCEEEFISGLHWMIRETVKEKFPLIANYLRPACDFSGKCLYAKSYSLSNAFGCLFASCGRHQSGTAYATFNESCTNIEVLEQQLDTHINRPNEWIEFTENDYNKLDDKDKVLFEDNSNQTATTTNNNVVSLSYNKQ